MLKRTPIRKKRKKPRPGRLEGPNIEALRLDCFVRDNWKCQKCGKGVGLMPHESSWSAHMSHIKAKRMGGDYLRNVETLCGDCHRTFHNCGPTMEKPCNKKPEELRR